MRRVASRIERRRTRRTAATALVLVWWLATPAICSAFLTSASCLPVQGVSIGAGADVSAPTPTEMPCHGESEAPAPAPARDDEGCCDGVELAVSAKLQVATPLYVAPAYAASLTAPVALSRTVSPVPYAVEELRSPFRHTSPPLLN